jgi:hypothetical protein
MKLTTIVHPETGNNITINGFLGYHPSISGLPIFLAEETVSSGYTDVSSIKNWSKHGGSIHRDYKFVRDHIKSLFTSLGGWGGLDAEEKQIVSQNFLSTKTQRDEIYTTEEQVDHGVIFHTKSVKSRQSRANKVIGEIINRMQPTDHSSIINDIMGASQLLDKYINFGREGTVEGDSEGAFDYLESRVGTTYENNGFREYAYTPTGYSDMTDFSTGLMDILKNGNYIC